VVVVTALRARDVIAQRPSCEGDSYVHSICTIQCNAFVIYGAKYGIVFGELNPLSYIVANFDDPVTPTKSALTEHNNKTKENILLQ
jgi:hypothetical protein